MSVTELVSGDTTFHIVGTAHVSQRSVDEVREVIARVRPDAVCVELDRTRYEALTRANAFRDLDVTKVVREGRSLYLLAHLGLAAYQRRLAASLGIKPGAEMLAAIEAANAGGIAIELIDRDIGITLKRTWRNLGPWKRLTLLASLLFGAGPGDPHGSDEPVTAQTIEDLKEPKALSEMLNELGRLVPQIKAPLIDERDQYLASKLRDAGAGRRHVVAVVGAAHLPGIQASFSTPIDRAALETIPPPPLAGRLIKWLVPTLLLAALIWGGRHHGASLAAMMRAWILPTAIGAGAGTLLAGGAPLSVLAAASVSPIAALQPRLRTSMIVGVLEAWRRRPSAAARERLLEELQSFRGFWRNPVTRILLIALASGIGTAIGFWVGVGWLAMFL